MRSVSPLRFHSLLAMAVLAMAPLSPDCAASSANELRASLRTCHAIANALRRLACFDRLARETQSAGTSISSDSDADRAPESDSASTSPAGTPSTSRAIRSHLTRIEQRPRGEWVFHLDNGQVWTEIEPGRTRYQEGVEARINRTLFGSYILSVEGLRATRVRRLR